MVMVKDLLLRWIFEVIALLPMVPGHEGGTAMQFERLRSVKQVVEASRATSPNGEPALTEGSLRWLIFNAGQNGLDQALVRVGRRVLIDTRAFNDWLERKRIGRT